MDIKMKKIVLFILIVISLLYAFFYVASFPHFERTCEITQPTKVIGGKLYNSWGPTQYFLSYAGKDKISGDDCVVSNVPVTLSEYERRMYAKTTQGGK